MLFSLNNSDFVPLECKSDLCGFWSFPAWSVELWTEGLTNWYRPEADETESRCFLVVWRLLGTSSFASETCFEKFPIILFVNVNRRFLCLSTFVDWQGEFRGFYSCTTMIGKRISFLLLYHCVASFPHPSHYKLSLFLNMKFYPVLEPNRRLIDH